MILLFQFISIIRQFIGGINPYGSPFQVPGTLLNSCNPVLKSIHNISFLCKYHNKGTRASDIRNKDDDIHK